MKGLQIASLRVIAIYFCGCLVISGTAGERHHWRKTLTVHVVPMTIAEFY